MSVATSAVVDANESQPSGLWVLFITEMWERFSYYGMRALLVLYLVSKTSGDNPGFGWTDEAAYKLYGWYTGLVYLTPIVGGWLADKMLGTHRSMLIGGWIIAAGHFALALTEVFSTGNATETVSFASEPLTFATFMLGLILIIVGTGFFKPCVSVMVGQLYSRNDPRRDSGFTIFYMGINVGAFLSGIVAGTLGEKLGWHWGFGSAGVGMLLGLATYQWLRPKYLGDIGLAPAGKVQESSVASTMTEKDSAEPLTRVDWERMAVIVILAIFGISFWVAFEQAGSSLNVFALESTNRMIGGYEFPATWYQSVNPLVIVLFGPVFAWLWVWLDRRGLQPSTPVKFSLGLILLSFGYVAMIFGALQAETGLAGPQWLMLTYLLHTWGELCLSPVGLSMVTKLAPQKFASLMMGVYFCSFFVANLAAGYLAAFSSRVASGEVFQVLGGQADFFLFLFVVPFAVGLLALAVARPIKNMMHGLH